MPATLKPGRSRQLGGQLPFSNERQPTGDQPDLPKHPTDRTAWFSRPLVIAVSLLGLAGLVRAYVRMSQRVSLDSDQYTIILQAQELLHGNLLLHHWWVPGDNFLTTDIAFHTIGVAFLGVQPAVGRYEPAVVYALTVATAVLLAQTNSRGVARWLRTLIVLALTAVPAAGISVESALRAGYHVSTIFLVLLSLLLIDRLPARWSVPLAFVLLTQAQFADPLGTVIGALPLAVVTGLRWWRHRTGRSMLDRQLFLVALLSAVVARLAERAVSAAGGFQVSTPLQLAFVSLDDLPKHTLLLLRLLLELFGANFFGQPVGRHAAGLILHGFGLLFVAAVIWTVIRRWRHGEFGDRTVELLITGSVILLAALFFSTYVIDPTSIRYAMPILFFGAVLAARLGADWLLSDRRLTVAAAALSLLYLAFLWPALNTPTVPNRPTQIVPWLQSHGLRYGIGGYWAANSVTVESGGSVQVSAVVPEGQKFGPYRWLSKSDWYDPREHEANFALIDTRLPGAVPETQLEQAFGAPREIDQVDGYVILIWDKNLLNDPGWSG